MMSINLLKNKRGSTLTNWIMIVLMVALFLVVFQTQVITPMNNLYAQNNSIGLNTDAEDVIDSISGVSNSSNTDIRTSEVSQLSDGFSLVKIGSMTKRVYGTLWDFVSGRFLYTLIVDQLDMPSSVAYVLMILIWCSLIFIIIRIFMRGATP